MISASSDTLAFSTVKLYTCVLLLSTLTLDFFCVWLKVYYWGESGVLLPTSPGFPLTGGVGSVGRSNMVFLVPLNGQFSLNDFWTHILNIVLLPSSSQLVNVWAFGSTHMLFVD